MVNPNQQTPLETFNADMAAMLREDEPQNELQEPKPFLSDRELVAIHRYCLRYRDLVRSGGTPTQKQDTCFMAGQRMCYATGVACGSA